MIEFLSQGDHEVPAGARPNRGEITQSADYPPSYSTLIRAPVTFQTLFGIDYRRVNTSA
jgi:hypothetical protein